MARRAANLSHVSSWRGIWTSLRCRILQAGNHVWVLHAIARRIHLVLRAVIRADPAQPGIMSGHREWICAVSDHEFTVDVFCKAEGDRDIVGSKWECERGSGVPAYFAAFASKSRVWMDSEDYGVCDVGECGDYFVVGEEED